MYCCIALYDDQTCWKHPLVYYSFKFYNVTSFCLSRALKAKTYEKSHNLWTIGDIYEASLQVVNLQLKHITETQVVTRKQVAASKSLLVA